MADKIQMKNITVYVEDFIDEVKAALQNAIERGLMAIGERAATHARDNLTALGAVDTGRLRNSITYATQGHDGETLRYTKEMQQAGQDAVQTPVKVSEPNTVYVGTAVFYGPYIELGTGNLSTSGGGTHKPSWTYQDEFGNWHIAFPQRRRPFLKPAVADHVKEFREILKESLENA